MNKPTFQIKTEEKKIDYGRFSIEPLEQGYGQTLGAGLRRVLLTSMPGLAITQVKISGLRHQFGSIKGIKEDGVDILLNLKRVRFSLKNSKQLSKPVKATLSVKGKTTASAGDIKTPAEIKVVNKDFVIAHLADSKSKLDIEMQIESGVGYSPSEERKTDSVETIPLDADFSPIKRVNYKVEETRVGRLTNFDKLTLEVFTDGSVEPEESLRLAAQVLETYLQQVISPIAPDKASRKESRMESSLRNLSVEELGLPTRISNALIKASYDTVADILEKYEELSKVRNLGGKSVKIIDAALREKGVEPK